MTRALPSTGAVSKSIVLALILSVCATSAEAQQFAERSDALGKKQPCAETQEGCYSSYVLLVDLNGDQHLDALFASGGGYYEPAEAETMAVYLNDGEGDFQEISEQATAGFRGRLRQLTVGDVDADGDLDVVAPDGYGMQADALFVNDGGSPPHFVDEGATRLGTRSRAGATRMGDLDGDGDLDLVVTDWGDAPPTSEGTAHAYENDGTGHFREIAEAIPSDTGAIGTGPIDVDLFDMDSDFDLDLLVASRSGESLLFRNRGDAHFEDASAELADQPGPYVYGPDPCDVDGDGDLDVWLDNGGPDAREQLLLNDGSGRFDEASQRIRGNTTADDNEVQCVDLDDDGDFDALVASLSGEERLLSNEGAGRFTAVDGTFPARGDATLGLDLGDLNGDGRLDAITAQGELGSYLNRVYLGTEAQPVDRQPPRIRAVEGDPRRKDGQIRVRFAVSDRATSDVGPRLSSAVVELVGGGSVPAHFVGGDLFHADVSAEGSIRYRVCATDAVGQRACSAELESLGPDATPPADRPPSRGCSLTPGAHGSAATLLLAVVASLLLRRRSTRCRAPALSRGRGWSTRARPEPPAGTPGRRSTARPG